MTLVQSSTHACSVSDWCTSAAASLTCVDKVRDSR